MNKILVKKKSAYMMINKLKLTTLEESLRDRMSIDKDGENLFWIKNSSLTVMNSQTTTS